MATMALLPRLVCLLICISITTASLLEYVPAFRGAVVQHVPRKANTARETIAENLELYAKHAERAARERADIIVFPEGGLISFNFSTQDEIQPYLEYVPDIAHPPAILCDPERSSSSSDRMQALSALSCLARKHRMYIVANIGESYACSRGTSGAACPARGSFTFNTDVVFDRRGRLVQRYRKEHLFQGESVLYDHIPRSWIPEVAAFDTDFGVRFGVIVCFDVFFREPAVADRRHAVDAFVMSLYWENDGTFPLMTAVQVQQGFSYALNTTLLASGIGVSGETSGSGIYSSGRAIAYDFVNREDERVVVASIPEHTRSFIRPDAPQSPASDSRSIVSRSTEKDIRHADVSVGEVVELRARTSRVSCAARFRVARGNGRIALLALSGAMFRNLLNANLCTLFYCSKQGCDALDMEYRSSVSVEALELTGHFPRGSLVYPMVAQDEGKLVEQVSTSQQGNGDVRMALQHPHSFLNAVLYAESPSS